MFDTALNFTKETINSLEIKSFKYFVADLKTPHLRVFVYPSSIKTYVLCRKVGGKWQRIKIGRASELTVEQARKEAARLNSLIAVGKNPHEEKQAARKEITFKELYAYYYHQHLVPHAKHPKANRRVAELHVFPSFGNMKVSDITPEKLRRYHTQIAEKYTKSTANRILTIISATYNFSIKSAYHKGVNPCTAVRRFKTSSRDRFLTLHELELFFDAVKEEEQLFCDFFLMLLYTAARKSNVLSMKWADIDFSLKRWRISDEETKNKEINTVVLCDPALIILERRIADNQRSSIPSPYVFPGDGADGYLNDPKRAFSRIRKRMQVSNFRMHDLRRTLASYMAIGGTSLPIIGKALNHKSQISTAIYARLSQEPVLEAVNNAVTMIRGSGKVTLFKQSWKMCEPILETIQFSDLLN